MHTDMSKTPRFPSALELDGIRKVTPLLLPSIRGQGPDVRAHVSESDSVRGVTGSAAVGGRGGSQEEGGEGAGRMKEVVEGFPGRTNR